MGKTANTIKTLAPVSFLFLFQGANHLPNQNSGCYCYWKHNFINKSPSQEKGEKADGLQICKVISISIPVHMGSSDLFNKSRTLKTALPCTRKGITFEAQMPWLFRTKWKSFCKCIPAKLKSSFQKVPLVKQKWKFLTFWSSECVPFETIGFYFRQWSISVVLRLGQRLIFMMEEHEGFLSLVWLQNLLTHHASCYEGLLSGSFISQQIPILCMLRIFILHCLQSLRGSDPKGRAIIL